jgi:hypothetical protein
MGSNANSEARLTIQETDEADNPTVTYIFSGQDTQKSASSGGGRVDILVSNVSYSVRCAFPRPTVGCTSRLDVLFEDLVNTACIPKELSIFEWYGKFGSCHMASWTWSLSGSSPEAKCIWELYTSYVFNS